MEKRVIGLYDALPRDRRQELQIKMFRDKTFPLYVFLHKKSDDAAMFKPRAEMDAEMVAKMDAEIEIEGLQKFFWIATGDYEGAVVPFQDVINTMCERLGLDDDQKSEIYKSYDIAFQDMGHVLPNALKNRTRSRKHRTRSRKNRTRSRKN